MKILFFLFFAYETLSYSFESVPNEYIIKWKSQRGALTLEKEFIENTTPINTSFGKFDVIQSFQDKSDLDFTKELLNNPDIEYIEPNYIYNLVEDEINEYAPKDHKLRVQEQWGMEVSQAKAAWKNYQGNQDIIVAIIDSGINYLHPDLKDNLWVNELEKNGIEGVDDDHNGYIDDIYGYDFAYEDPDPLDGNGHGSHCAGIIGATHNNIGIYGVAKNVKLMGVQFSYSVGGTTLDRALKAIDYAIKNGAKIISNSWGGFPYSHALKDAIEEANDKGIVFVVAAGNKKRNIDKEPFYPASYKVPNIIVVGAHDPKNLKASFSNYGTETIDIFAPGTNILSTIRYNNVHPYWYEKRSGTSMATPFVAGAIALLLSQKPELSPKEIKNHLEKFSTPTHSLKKFGFKGNVLNIMQLLEL